MAKVEYIRDLYENEGKSLRAISRETQIDFRTVQKYAHCDNWSLPDTRIRPEGYPILGKYISTINEWLERDEREPRKQRHTAVRVYKRLQDEKGYKGSYCPVRRYCRRKKEEMRRMKESFLPLAHYPGCAQVDFGKFKYYDADGIGCDGNALIMSFPHSNSGWMQVFPSENQECLLTGLKRIFGHIGGVPVRLRLDNMATAVAQILKGTERVISDGFYRFMLHYRFKADFCNAAKGNEKGSVENKVGYTRRNLLVPVPTITDFDAFNVELLKRCDADHDREHYEKDATITELWKADKSCLLALPGFEYEVFRYESLAVNKTGFIAVDTNKYGLSPELANRVVQVKIYFDKIEAYYDHTLLKVFRRSYEKNTEECDWKTYLPTLVKKPGATEHTRFFNQMPKLWQAYLRNTKGAERKSALMLLSDIVQDGNEILCDDALKLANEYGTADSDSIRQCYVLLTQPTKYPKPLKLAVDTPVINYNPDLSVYDRLTGGAR